MAVWTALSLALASSVIDASLEPQAPADTVTMAETMPVISGVSWYSVTMEGRTKNSNWRVLALRA